MSLSIRRAFASWLLKDSEVLSQLLRVAQTQAETTLRLASIVESLTSLPAVEGPAEARAPQELDYTVLWEIDPQPPRDRN
jgi:hypothetical protein